MRSATRTWTIVAGQASDALAQLDLGGIKLILLDYLLPGGGARDVMARADQAGVPTIVMSGDVERMAEMNAGDRPFIAKPFHIEELIRLVGTVLGGD